MTNTRILFVGLAALLCIGVVALLAQSGSIGYGESALRIAPGTVISIDHGGHLFQNGDMELGVGSMLTVGTINGEGVPVIFGDGGQGQNRTVNLTDRFGQPCLMRFQSGWLTASTCP